MLNRFKGLVLTTGLLLMAAGVQPAFAKRNASLVAPSYSMLARGTSVDGYWTTDFPTWGWNYWNGCSFCTNDVSCQCFSADSNAGSGIFQVNINQYTTMNWSTEIDYTNDAATPSGSNWDYCFPASGEGEATDIGGSSANYLDYSTTGQLCETPWGPNQTYTGSFIITGGGGLYANYQGAGTIGHGIYGRLPNEVVSQIQFNGNIGPAAPSPSPLPTPSPGWSSSPTPSSTPSASPSSSPTPS